MLHFDKLNTFMPTNMWNVTVHIFCTENWRSFVALYWPTWRWISHLSRITDRSFSNRLEIQQSQSHAQPSSSRSPVNRMTSFHLWCNFLNIEMPNHKLYTNKMHYIFTLYTLFCNPYICFGLYMVIFRGFLNYFHLTSNIFVCYHI
jgi:hypothetical protein